MPLYSFTNFGDLLKFLRRRAQLTQRELSIAVGYSESQISRLESNQRAPDRSTLLALFIPALHIESEQEIIEKLLELADANRFETRGARSEVYHSLEKPNHLPIQLASFIGRRKDLEAVGQLLGDMGVRLVTLTGEGGSGKTRLALEAGTRLAHQYEHGVWLVELGPITDPNLILNAALSALNLQASADRSSIRELTDFLCSRELLLILDNCEHLIEAAAQWSEKLLRACPRLKILATSRECLGVPGEQLLRVLPLSLPPTRRGVLPSKAQVEAYEGIQLFVARASSALRTFRLTDQNAPAITRICQFLDGIPLAIELAAVWVDTMSVEQIANRLAVDFDLLGNRIRTALPQHKTLRAAIDWSYMLLAETERTLLRRLSVFSGGWTLEAAEAVASGNAEDSRMVTKAQVLSLHSTLVSKSLIVADQTEEEEVRYRLLETIRSYMREKDIEAGEMAWLQSKHLDYFVSLAERAEPELKTERQIQWMGWLLHEQDNFRAALQKCLTDRNAVEGLRLAGALGHYWWMRGFDNENTRWLEAILEMAETSASLQLSQARAKILLYLGLVYYELGDGDHSRRLWEECTQIAGDLGDAVWAGASLCFLGVYYGHQHKYDEAQATFQESLQNLQRAEDDWWIAETLH